MKTCPPSTDQGPRHVGWPCMGHHVPGPQRTNKFAAWQACNHCGLRLRYTTKGTGAGDNRAIGPPPDHVELAQLELQESSRRTRLRGRSSIGSSGDSRSNPGGDPWTRPRNGSGPSERDLGRGADGWGILLTDHGEPKQDTVPQRTLANPPEPTEAFDQDCDGEQPEGEERGDRPDSSSGQSHERDIFGGDHQPGGVRSGEEGAPGGEGQDRGAGHQEGEGGRGIQGRVNALWKALSGLRQKMRSSCPTRLEADLDTNPGNFQMSPTRQQPITDGEFSLQPHGTTSTTSPTFGGELCGAACTTCSTGSLCPSTARHQEIGCHKPHDGEDSEAFPGYDLDT